MRVRTSHAGRLGARLRRVRRAVRAVRLRHRRLRRPVGRETRPAMDIRARETVTWAGRFRPPLHEASVVPRAVFARSTGADSPRTWSGSPSAATLPRSLPPSNFRPPRCPRRDRVGGAAGMGALGTASGVIRPGRSLIANVTASCLALCGTASGGTRTRWRALGSSSLNSAAASSGRGRGRPVTNQGKDGPLRGAMPGMKLGAGGGCAWFAVVSLDGAGREGACWVWRAVRRHRVTMDRSRP